MKIQKRQLKVRLRESETWVNSKKSNFSTLLRSLLFGFKNNVEKKKKKNFFSFRRTLFFRYIFTQMFQKEKISTCFKICFSFQNFSVSFFQCSETFDSLKSVYLLRNPFHPTCVVLGHKLREVLSTSNNFDSGGGTGTRYFQY